MRLILSFLPLVAAAPAWAEWVTYRKDDQPVFYPDPATVRKDGHLRRVRHLQDYKRSVYGMSSIRGLVEYDGKEERERSLTFSFHSEPMASGKILLSGDQPGNWRYIPPVSPRVSALISSRP